jgi:hypothetical protein
MWKYIEIYKYDKQLRLFYVLVGLPGGYYNQ